MKKFSSSFQMALEWTGDWYTGEVPQQKGSKNASRASSRGNVEPVSNTNVSQKSSWWQFIIVSAPLWLRVTVYGLLFILALLFCKVLFIDMGFYDRLMSVSIWIRWIKDHGGAILFINLCAVAAMISIPPLAIDVVMNVVAGAAYGTLMGTLYYVTGTAIGCFIAFHVFKFSCTNNSCFASQSRGCLTGVAARAKALSLAMKDDWTGLQITLLLRVSPITPLSLCTALLALTELRFWPYALGTLVGLVPASLPYCYLGSIGKDMADQGFPQSTADIVGYVIGGVATILVTYKVYLVSERVLNSVTPPVENDSSSSHTRAPL
mmetsp:Transcript_10009/g.15003  ORF Transcript_10009/g.15003 Transcript_10009/m.15003 type:complete len:321 (+) Transcript_10009:112-1074(+)